jgi:hypothetical protein
MLRHARGYALATSLLEGNDTRALQAYPRMEAEASRMVTEKIAAAAEAQAVAAVAAFGGRPPHVVANKALRVVKKRVRANKRRLSRS